MLTMIKNYLLHQTMALLWFWSSTDSNYSVELQYVYKPTSIVTNTTGTWLSTNARNGLLFACLSEAYLFMKGDAQLQEQYERRFQEEISRLKNRAEGRGRRDEYRFDSLRSQIT